MKKWIGFFLMVLFCTGCLAGCALQQEEENMGYVLWFAGDIEKDSTDARALASVSFPEPEITVDSLMLGLLEGPDRESGLLNLIPEGTQLLGWTLSNGLLKVNLSSEYRELTGIDLTLADYSITLTLCQLDEVQRVSISVDGQPLDSRYRQILSEDQVIFSGVEEEPVEKSVALYFPRSGGRGLGVEIRNFQLTEDDILAEVVTRALISGPNSDELTAFLPDGIELRDLRLEDGVCQVDFSEELLTMMPENEDRQLLVIYAIVNSLGNLDSVESVQIFVEGEQLTRYGQIFLPETLEPDFGMVE